MKRLFDVALAAMLLCLVVVPMLCIAVAINLTSRGSAIHWSARVGKDNRRFHMPKFRSMRTDTPQLATHLLPDPEQWFTPLGAWLRKMSLDELPQLWSILKGDMSFVGPRPALFNQHDLIEKRSKLGVEQLLPGLTGWAQINGRDTISIEEKVSLEEYYMIHRSLWLDAWIVFRTAINVLHRDEVVEAGPRTATSVEHRTA